MGLSIRFSFSEHIHRETYPTQFVLDILFAMRQTDMCAASSASTPLFLYVSPSYW